jgi:enoyl-CoA hydratase
MAGQIANQYVKEAVYKGSEMSLEQGLRLEADLNIILQSTKDRTEGINSFNEKRSPNFTGE